VTSDLGHGLTFFGRMRDWNDVRGERGIIIIYSRVTGLTWLFPDFVLEKTARWVVA